jgi:alcohol dehydrogenase
MKAAVLEKAGAARPYAQSKPLTLAEVAFDPPKIGELLVEIKAVGLCHSDLSVINGDRPWPLPMVLGHEAAGRVLECGEGVTNFHEGDHVALTFVPSCGSCRPCAEGRPGLCEPGLIANRAGTLLNGERRLRRDGAILNHHIGVSGFAEYAVVSQRSAVKIDDDLPSAEAALFGCAVLTGVGAVVNTAKVPAGSSVAVIGLGGVGLNSLLAAVLVGAREIIAIDLNPDKLSLATQLGATKTWQTGRETVGQIKDFTKGGVEYAFEMAGSSAALELAYAITRRGGTTVTAGLPHPDQRFALSPALLVGEERILRGSYIGSAVPLRDIPRYIALYRAGKLPVNKILTRQLRLEELNEGFDQLADGRVARQVAVL